MKLIRDRGVRRGSSWLRSTLTILVIGGLLLALVGELANLWAARRRAVAVEQADRCRLYDALGGVRPGVTPDLAIDGCTAFIESGEATPRELARAYNSRGTAWSAKQQPETALQDFDRAIKFDSNDYSVYDNRGAAYFALGQVDRAIADYDYALWLDPRFSFALINRGNAYHAKGQEDRALQDYDEAIKINPGLAVVFSNRGAVYHAKGQEDRALQDFDEAIKINPGLASAFSNRGNVFLAQGQYKRALQEYDRALQLDPRSAAAFTGRGLAKLCDGASAAAAEDFAQAVGIRPDQAYDVLWLHIARARAGADDGRELAKNVLRLDMKRWPAPVAALYLGKTNRDAVRAAANQGDDATRSGQACEADFYIGALELQTGSPAAAKALFQAAVGRCPPSYLEAQAAAAELKRLPP